MKHRQLALLAFLAVISLLACPSSPAAGTTIEPAAAEAALRQADADWAAAGTAGVEAWMVFYTADAIVLLPKGQLASGKELVRQSVGRLLAQPHLAVASHPLKVQMAPSGDLAFVSSSYELRFSDARGMPVSDRGRRIEIWRKQVDGPWKCIVDAWSSDEPVAAAPAALPTAPAAAPPTSAPGTPPTAIAAAPASPSMPTEPPQPVRSPEPDPLTPASTVATKYGDMPTDYKEEITRYFQDHLKNPESIRYREITKPEQGYVTSIVGNILMREERVYGWKVKATINATNSHAKYVGFKTYTFLFRGEKIVNALAPLPEDEMK